MGEKVKFGLELQDGVSAPARKVTAAVDKVTAAVDKQAKAARMSGDALAKLYAAAQQKALAGKAATEKASKATEKASGLWRDAAGRWSAAGGRFASTAEKAAAGIDDFGSAAGKAGGATSTLSKFFSGLTGDFAKLAGAQAIGSLVADALKAAASAAIQAGIAIARFAASTVASFTKAVFAAANFREQTIRSLQAVTGGKGLGTFEKFKSLAIDLGQDLNDTLSTVKKFRLAGFGDDMAKQLLLATSAMGGLGASRDEVGRINLAITQIANNGKLAAEELNQLGDAGLPKTQVIEAIAKALGKTKAEAVDLIGKGKVSSEVAIQGVIDAVKKLSGGDLEKFAKQALKTVPGAFGAIKSQVQGLFDDIGKGVNVKPLVDAMTRIREALGSPEAKAFAADMQRVFSEMTKQADRVFKALQPAIEQLTGGLLDKGEDGKTFTTVDKLVMVVQKVGDAFTLAAKLVKPFFDGIDTGKTASIAGSVGHLETALGQLEENDFFDDLKLVANAAGMAIGYAVSETAGFLRLWRSLSEVASQFETAVRGAFTTAVEEVDKFLSKLLGVKSAIGSIVKALGLGPIFDLGDSAAEKALNSQDAPMKAAQAATGATILPFQRAAAEAPGVRASVYDERGNIRPPPSFDGAASGSSSTTNNDLRVNINVSGDVKDPSALVALVRQQVAIAMKQSAA